MPAHNMSNLSIALGLHPDEKDAEEVDEDFEKRLKNAAAWVNDHHDVDGLWKEMPSRMDDLVHVTKGARLNK